MNEKVQMMEVKMRHQSAEPDQLNDFKIQAEKKVYPQNDVIRNQQDLERQNVDFEQQQYVDLTKWFAENESKANSFKILD